MKEEMEQWLDPKSVEEPKKTKWPLVGFIIVGLFLIFVIFEIIISRINLYRIYDEKEPYFLISTKVEEQPDGQKKVFDFGLYKIVEKKLEEKTVIQLRIWFYEDEK